MDVTVAICTWNRAKVLDQTLQEMRRLRIPDDLDWEVLVVNNNSTDDTEDVLAQHKQYLPLRSVLEAKQGKTNALNTAIDCIRSDLILWTDDDVLVHPDWLSVYVETAKKTPEVDFWGGAIEPCFEVPPPDWVLRAWNEVATAFVSIDPSNYCEEIGNGESSPFPMGANWAIRTSAQKQYRYDPHLGPNGGKLLYGDETAVMKRMLNNGLKGRWCSQAKVRHFNQKERSTEAYLRRYFYGVGRSHFRFLDAVSDRDSVGRLQPFQFGIHAVIAEAKYRLGRYTRPPKYWVRNLRKCSLNWGLLAGYVDQIKRAA